MKLIKIPLIEEGEPIKLGYLIERTTNKGWSFYLYPAMILRGKKGDVVLNGKQIKEYFLNFNIITPEKKK